MPKSLAAALLLAALPMPAAAVAVPTYLAAASGGTDSVLDEDGSAASASAGGASFDGAFATGSAVAGGLGLGAGATAAVPARTLDGDFDGIFNPAAISGGGSARFRIEDLVFSRDDPADMRSVAVSTLLPIDGVFLVARDLSASGRAVAGLGVDYGLGAPGFGSTAAPRAIGTILYGSDGTSLIDSASGIFAGLDGQAAIDGVFQTPVFDVPIDTPLVLTIILRASAGVAARDGAPVEAASDFMSTLAFLPGELVFALPDGVSARSATAGIEGNRWPGAVAPTPVPLPPAAALLTGALAGIALLARPSGRSPWRRGMARLRAPRLDRTLPMHG